MIDPVADYQKTILSKVGLKIKPTDVVLDLGCGRGDNSVHFSKKAKKVIGVDIERWKEWENLKSKNLEFLISDARRLPFKDESFDVVFTKDTLHHILDKEKVLKEIKRVTKKGGRIYIVEVNRYNPIAYIHLTMIGHHDHFSKGQFEKLILKFFKNVEFKHAESRVYPLVGELGIVAKFLHKLERILEKTPIVNRFTTYNIATIRNI